MTGSWRGKKQQIEHFLARIFFENQNRKLELAETKIITLAFLYRFDLTILPGILWLPSSALHIHNVGYASDTEQ